MLIKTRTVVLLLCGLVAWCSNPDQESFGRWMGRRLEVLGDPLAQTVSSADAALLLMRAGDCQRVDFAFFSVMRLHGRTPATFFGALGSWVPLGREVVAHKWKADDGEDT